MALDKMPNARLAGELLVIAGEEDLMAYESGDYVSEDYHTDRSNIIREAARRILNAL